MQAITFEGKDYAPKLTRRPQVCDCGHAPKENGISAGYSLRPDGKTICAACERTEEAAAMADGAPLLIVYPHCEGPSPTEPGRTVYTLRTWAGEILCYVYRHSTYRNNWGAQIHCWQAYTDQYTYSGRNAGVGMALRLRRTK